MTKPTDVPTVEEASRVYVESFNDLTDEQKQQVAENFTRMVESENDKHGLTVMRVISAWLDRMGHIEASKDLRAETEEAERASRS